MKDPQVLRLLLAWLPATITVVTGILVDNSKLADFRRHMDKRFDEIDRRFDDLMRY
jgi:hypothetical protein